MRVPGADCVTEKSLTTGLTTEYFGGAACPSRGISLGLGQLLRAEMVILLASGGKKAEIIKAALEGPVTAAVPASLLRGHSNSVCLLDEGAASYLSNGR